MINIITKLLNGMNIEWKPLGELLIRTKGTKITASQMKELHKDDAPLKIFAGGKTFALVNFDDIPEKDINGEPSIIVKSRGVIEFEYYDKPFSHKNEMWSYHSKDKNINIKYIYYVLKNQERYFQNIGAKMQMPQIATPDTDKFEIPVPPISAQTEIVRILDTFTALTAELTAELATRKKQYNYYLDKLLTFKEDEVEWKALGDVFNIFAGGDVPKDALSEKESKQFNIPILSNGIGSKSLYGWTNIPKINKPSLTISARGTIGWANYQEKPFYPVVRLLVLTPKIKVNLKYTYYFMKYIENDYKVPKSGIPQLTKPMIKDKSIPIPPLKEQARIVEILDKFDALTNSITEGLPREIELRQKQYEYYRNLLLDFPKAEQ
jgi:type I restriction enzyme, S subunit